MCHDAHLRFKLMKYHLITVFADPLPSIVAKDSEVPEDVPTGSGGRFIIPANYPTAMLFILDDPFSVKMCFA